MTGSTQKGGGTQMFVMQIIKHAPEQCPVYNPKYLDGTIKWFEKIESVASKNGVKVIGSWTDHGTHTTYSVFETQSMDNIMKLAMEPEFAAGFAYNTIQTFPVFAANEVLGLLKQAKK
jgi:uncharacterized protein with GYD domain